MNYVGDFHARFVELDKIGVSRPCVIILNGEDGLG